MPRRVGLLVAAVVAAGGAVAVWAALRLQPPDPGALALIGAGFLSGLLIVEFSSVSAESVTFALVAAALLAFGPPAAVVTAVAGEAGSAFRSPRPPAYRSAYNATAHAIAAAAYAALYAAGSGIPGHLSPLGALLVIAASPAYFFVSSGLVALAIGWSTAADPRAVWARSFRWLAPHYPALAFIGLVLARGQMAAGPLGVLVFCLPLLMSHYSVAIFVKRTKDQMHALESANTRLEVMNAALTETLASVVDARDLYLYRHSHHAAAYTERIARHLALPEEEVQLAKQGALLHDIGKIGIPEAILRKPGPLDDAERGIMNSHSEIGAEIVARTRELAPVAAIVRAHHERFDGAGYPDGLAGEQIPIAARILSVLEAFDAMISDRPYRAAMSLDEALAEIKRCAGTQFDPHTVRAFLAVIRTDGTGWLENSAADTSATGKDLFLPKGLAHQTHDHPNGRTQDGSDRRLRLVR